MRAEEILKQMTAEEKIGQICVPILQKGEITPEVEEYIRIYGVGMIRFCPNAEFDNASVVVGEPNPYKTASEMAAFTNELQKIAQETKHKIPLIIAVDQEGGTRNDINRGGAMVYASHMCFGAADDTELTYQIAKGTAEEFRAMGINMVQAPIVDVFRYQGRNTMKAASFGEDKELVARHAKAMQKGLKDGGLIAMIKHFPGYGSLATDAHKGTARITKSWEELKDEDLYPFAELFADGVDGIMAGHVITECLDHEYPATLSKKMIQGVLRDEMGFEGIIETDAMRMHAIQDHYGTGPASVLAVNAGNDLVLLRGSAEHFKEGYDALLSALKSGALAMETVDKAVLRILKLKEEKGLFENPFADSELAEKTVGSAKHRKMIDAFAKRSVTILKSKWMPLNEDDETLLVISPEPQKIAAAEDGEQCPEMLLAAIKRRNADTQTLLTALEPTTEEMERALQLAERAEKIVIGTCNAILYEGQRRLVKKLQQTGKPVLVVAMESPCDIDVLDDVTDYVCMYGCAASWAEAAADCLFGKNPGNAKLPIQLQTKG